MATSYKYSVRNPDNLSDTEILAEAHELVECFLELLRCERIGNDILDISVLPASRSSFENAFRLVIATEARKQTRNRLKAAGLALAQFQPGIGARMSIRPVRQAGSAEASQHASHIPLQSIDMAFASMASDAERLRTSFAKAEDIAERRFGVSHITPPFREDGTYNWYGHH